MAQALAACGQAPGVCLPDVQKVMRPVIDLYHVEPGTERWLAAENWPDTAQRVHAAIAGEVAEALGVQTLRQVVQVLVLTSLLCVLHAAIPALS